MVIIFKYYFIEVPIFFKPNNAEKQFKITILREHLKKMHNPLSPLFCIVKMHSSAYRFRDFTYHSVVRSWVGKELVSFT